MSCTPMTSHEGLTFRTKHRIKISQKHLQYCNICENKLCSANSGTQPDVLLNMGLQARFRI